MYLCESFGNATRIDYGTGHETNFIAFLCCLDLVGVVNKSDDRALILALFQRYLVLVRRLQIDYKMEPAGSHGVHSLDDYQFLCFLYGSIQLGSQGDLQPADFPKPEVVEAHKDKVDTDDLMNLPLNEISVHVPSSNRLHKQGQNGPFLRTQLHSMGRFGSSPLG